MLKQIFKLFFLISVFFILTKKSLADEPLVYSDNLIYQGAFRVPQTVSGAGDIDRSGETITFNPAGDNGNGSLFIEGHAGQPNIAEISIESPKLSNYNIARALQPLADPTEGNILNIGSGGTSILTATGNGAEPGGLLVYNNKLIGTSFSYYDASGGGVSTQLSHYTHSLNLSETGTFHGMYHVGSYPASGNASFVSGYMSLTPNNSLTGGSNWENIFGGSALTGNGCLSVISRTSLGPAAFSFDPDSLVGPVGTSVSATPLLYYPSTNPTLGVNSATNTTFNATTAIGGMVMIPGSRTVLFVGKHGLGNWLYGDYTNDPSYADQCDPAIDNCIWKSDQGSSGIYICSDPNNCISGKAGLGCGETEHCYWDPMGAGKGPHAYPYVYQVWAYDANDLAHVKNGDTIGSERSVNIDASCTNGTTYQPWCIKPYAVWQLPFDFAPTSATHVGAVAYDPQNKLLYVSEPGADVPNEYARMPLIHVFHIDLNVTPKSSYHVKAKFILLNGSVTLKNNNSEELVVSSSDRNQMQTKTFINPISTGGTYDVKVTSQPSGQFCTVLNGSGAVNSNSDIENIIVSCHNSFSIDSLAPFAPSGLIVQ